MGFATHQSCGLDCVVWLVSGQLTNALLPDPAPDTSMPSTHKQSELLAKPALTHPQAAADELHT